jgi:phage gp46-like protein
MSDVAVYYLPPAPTLPASRPQGQRRAVCDVLMLHREDGGDIELISGEPTMSDGLFNAVYLSLFGGNVEDSGLPGDVRLQWWGNFSEPDPARRYRSETQFCLQTLPPTTYNLRRVELAVKNDLAWLLDAVIVRDVASLASMPARNHVKLAIAVEVLTGEVYRFAIPKSWGDRTT